MSDLEQLFPLPVLLHEKAKIDKYLEQDMSLDAVSERIASILDRKVHYRDKKLLALICKHLLIIIEEILSNGAVPYYLEKNIIFAKYDTKITSYQRLETSLMANRRFVYGYYSIDQLFLNVTGNLDILRERMLARNNYDLGISFESVLSHELRHMASSYRVGQDTPHYHFGYDSFWASPDTNDVRNTPFNEALTERLTIDTFDDLKHRKNYKRMGVLVLQGFLLINETSVIKNYYMGNLSALIDDLEPHFKDRHQIYKLLSLSTSHPTNENMLKIIMIFKEILGHKYYDYISYLVNHKYIDLSLLDPTLEEQPYIRKRGL